MSNRVTLAELGGMSDEEASALSLEQIAMLLEDVTQEKARVAGLGERLHALLHARYASQADQVRRTKGLDTGRVRVLDGEHTIVADLPKAIVWDQAKLKECAATVASWGEPIEQYLGVKYSVPEARFTAWPESIQKVFLPARTLSTGKPTYAIERKEAA